MHASAWKKLFDSFLKQRATQAREPFVPFDIDADYQRYVDGKPRYDGVAAFLKSRGIELPWGTPEDGPDVQSVCALGKKRTGISCNTWRSTALIPYEASISLVRQLRAHEIKTAVVSSSDNRAAVLEAAGIAQLFDARVDGTDITRLDLKGKPTPISLCVDGKVYEFVSGTTRVFRLNDEATDRVIVEKDPAEDRERHHDRPRVRGKALHDGARDGGPSR